MRHIFYCLVHLADFLKFKFFFRVKILNNSCNCYPSPTTPTWELCMSYGYFHGVSSFNENCLSTIHTLHSSKVLNTLQFFPVLSSTKNCILDEPGVCGMLVLSTLQLPDVKTIMSFLSVSLNTMIYPVLVPQHGVPISYLIFPI